MAKTLSEISAEGVKNGIFEDNYEHIPVGLDPQSSNIVFQKFTENEHTLTEKRAKLFRNCHVTRFEGITRMNRYHFELIQACQDVEALELQRIEDSREFRINVQGEEKVSVTAILERILTPSSRETLKKLTIHRRYVDYGIDWKEMPRFAPNLQYLNIPNCPLELAELGIICDSFPELIELDISNSGLVSLNGIRKLQNLQVLRMEGVEIQESSSLVDIFELKNLRALIISDPSEDSPSPCTTLEAYLGCGRVLLELRFLDVSYTRVTAEMVKKLVATHPKLELIGLISTNLETNFVLDQSSVKLLTVNTPEDCIKSLDFYMKNKSFRKYTKHIVFTIFGILQDRYEELTKDSKLKLFRRFITLFIKAKEFSVHYNLSLQCLFLLTLRTRAADFEQPELRQLGLVLLKIKNPQLTNTQEFDETRIFIYTFKWRMLTNRAIRGAFESSELSQICQQAMTYLTLDDGTADVELLISVLARILRRRPILENLREISETRGIKRYLIALLERKKWNEPEKWNFFVNFTTVISELSQHFQERHWTVSREYIKLWLRQLDLFTGNPEGQKSILVVLSRLVPKMDKLAYETFFEETHFAIVLKCISSEHKSTQKIMMYLLTDIVIETLKIDVQKVSSAECKKLLEMVKSYKEPAENATKTGLFEFILQSEEEGFAKTWAKTILEYLEQNEKKHRKRRLE